MADALAKAKQLLASGSSPTAKKSKVDLGHGSSSNSDDQELITQLLSMCLHMRNDVNSVYDCKNVAIIIEDPTLQETLYDLKELWWAQRPSTTESSKPIEPHPLGPKGPIMHTAIMEAIIGKSQAGQPVHTAATSLQQVPAERLNLAISSFKPKYQSPKSGRKWVWNLLLSDFVEENMKASYVQLFGANIDGIKVAPGHTAQNKQVQKLWEAYFKRTGKNVGKARQGGA